MSTPLFKEIRVNCPAGEAFHIFTNEVDLWWPRGHRRLDEGQLVLEPHVGGRFFERNAAGEQFELGEVLECSPPKVLSFTWTLGAISKPTRVDIHFEEDGSQTWVRVRHSEADSALGDEWPKRVALFTRGWDHVLEALELHIIEIAKRKNK